MIKVVAPNMACQVIDWAMQAHGGGGMCDDFPLAYAYAGARTLRFADGPDEVHRNAIAKWELGKYGSLRQGRRGTRHARQLSRLRVPDRWTGHRWRIRTRW
jgi:acyl-CoA dehydrogenase